MCVCVLIINKLDKQTGHKIIIIMHNTDQLACRKCFMDESISMEGVHYRLVHFVQGVSICRLKLGGFLPFKLGKFRASCADQSTLDESITVIGVLADESITDTGVSVLKDSSCQHRFVI